MEYSKVNVEVFEEPLEPLIIIEEGDITEVTVTLSPETIMDESCEEKDAQQKEMGKVTSESEEDGDNRKHLVSIEQVYKIRYQTGEINRDLVTEEEEHITPVHDDVEQADGSSPEEIQNIKEIDQKEADGHTIGGDDMRRSQVGLKMEEIKSKNNEEDSKLLIATSTQALQMDPNRPPASDQPRNEMLKTGDSEKQARRLTPDFPDTLYELLCTFQEGRRLNDQRCSFRLERGGRRRRCHSEPSATMPANRVLFSSMTSLQKEEFFELVATSQARRLDDQRADSLRNPPAKAKVSNKIRGSLKRSILRKPAPVAVPKEDLYNMILNSQAQGRLEEQRSAAPGPMDDEDFFSLLLRVQGGRMEEQRTELPTVLST